MPLEDTAKKFNEFLEKNPTFLGKVENYLKNWPDYHRKDWTDLARYGWFLNWNTPITGLQRSIGSNFVLHY